MPHNNLEISGKLKILIQSVILSICDNPIDKNKLPTSNIFSQRVEHITNTYITNHPCTVGISPLAIPCLTVSRIMIIIP